MNQTLGRTLSEIDRRFEAAATSLNTGDFAAFQKLVIEAREELKALAGVAAIPSVLSPEVALRWRRLNATFESIFEWLCGLDLLTAATWDPSQLPVDGPNFLGAKADLLALRHRDVRELVMVGSGAFPQTLLYLCVKTTIARLIGVDFDADRVFFSQRLIERGGLDSRIMVHVNSADEFDYRASDVVIVASLVEGKDAVLQRIAATSRPGTLVLMRVPVGWGEIFYEGLGPVTPADYGFQRSDTYRSGLNALFETQVFRRETS